jgi:hypothetical protein
MFSLPQEFQIVLSVFAPLFSLPVWSYVQTLAIGAILCTGKRTITSALRVQGLEDDKGFTNYHRVFNRAQWSALQGAKILFGLLIKVLPHWVPLIVLIDETIERRKGKKIKAKGCYRDSVRSTEKHVVKCFGLKWISMMLLVPVPWAKRPWALPFLTVLAPSQKCNEANGKRHKTTVDWACQMIKIVSRWAADRSLVLVGDGAYAAVVLAHCCAGLPVPVTLISRLRLDAALYDFPGPQPKGKPGPKPKKGERQPSLAERIDDPATQWMSIEILWYDGLKRTLEIFWGVSLWYTPGQDPIAIKWVVVCDPKGKLRNEAFFSTNLEATALQILRWFIMRWNIEVTFEELRAHLGFETQRQWSDLAIARMTPALFAMFSLIVLMALEIVKDGTVPILRCAWYKKSEATFSDVIALVRRHIWSFQYLVNSSQSHTFSQFDLRFFKAMLDQICYSP